MGAKLQVNKFLLTSEALQISKITELEIRDDMIFNDEGGYGTLSE